MKRTQEEIVARMKEVEQNDYFGYQRSDLLEYLDFDHAKEWLKPETTRGQWDEAKASKTPREQMIDYMEFAWEKANRERGLSAARSMDHYTSWLWLDGDEELHTTLAEYTEYGKPQLRKICEYLGIDYKQYE